MKKSAGSGGRILRLRHHKALDKIDVRYAILFAVCGPACVTAWVIAWKFKQIVLMAVDGSAPVTRNFLWLNKYISALTWARKAVA